MLQFINLIASFMASIWRVCFDQVMIPIGAYNVSFGSIIIVFVVIAMVASIYWKGAKG